MTSNAESAPDPMERADRAWQDFDDADQQPAFDLIPHGKLAKVRMRIRRGGYDDPARGWTGGYVTVNPETSSAYLSCEFVVLAGEYAYRKLWSTIGLHSPKSAAWAAMGRAFIRALLNSSRRIMPGDTSPAAKAARRISGLFELDGLIFVARIETEKDTRGDGSTAHRNVIRHAIEPDHKEYVRLMNMGASADTAPSCEPGRPTWG